MCRLRKWVAAAVLICIGLPTGLASAESCESEDRHLVYAGGGTPTLYAWPSEEVHLVCRAARAGNCQWKNGDSVIGNSCQISTTSRGEIRCLHGEEVWGAINLRNPNTQDVEDLTQSGYYRNSFRYYPGDNPNSRFPTFLCYKRGKIIDERGLCDGTNHCVDGEDEENCVMDLPCGSPAVWEHSHLVTPSRTKYLHDANVTYGCQAGYFFEDTISTKNRTCRNGRWEPARAPICHKNLAAGRTVKGNGALLLPGMASQAVVDGNFDSWCIFSPSLRAQSLSVSLAEGDMVSKVLIKSSSARYEVLLASGNSTETAEECTCSPSSVGASSPELYGVSVCSCPDSDVQAEAVVVRSPRSVFMALTVAEIVVIDSSQHVTNNICELLDQPVDGKVVQTADSESVSLVCDPGYYPACPGFYPCQKQDIPFECLAVTCPSPPQIPRAKVVSQNGTGWQSVTEYECVEGYTPFPDDQPMKTICQDDNLWSIGHISCVSETDIRVVTSRLARQHQQSVNALRAELEALRVGQLQMILQLQQQLERTQGQLNMTRQELSATQQQLHHSPLDKRQSAGVTSPAKGVSNLSQAMERKANETKEHMLSELSLVDSYMPKAPQNAFGESVLEASGSREHQETETTQADRQQDESDPQPDGSGMDLDNEAGEVFHLS